MTARIIEATASAWLGDSFGPDDLSGDPIRAIQSITATAADSDWTEYGFTRVGTIRFEITVDDDKSIVESKVEALRAQQTNVMAEAQAKHTDLERKIQNLLAISYEPAAA